MSYRIAVNKSAAKVLKKVPKADRKRIIDKIDSLAESPPNPDTTKMRGNNPFHKLRGIGVCPWLLIKFLMSQGQTNDPLI